MSSPKVSIHIISYNQKRFIGEALKSACSQDYPHLEIVVADDASSDGTADIIRDWARKDARIVPVLGQENVGITGNSNRGLEACSGELVAFMGGDDVLFPGKIRAQVEWFSGDPRRVLCGHQVEVFYDGGSTPPHPLSRRLLSGRGAEPLILHGPFGATSTMVRRNRIPTHGFDEQLRIVSDQLLWIEVVGLDGLFGFVAGTLAGYRRHESNVTNDPFAYLDDIARLLSLIRERFPAFAATVRSAETRRLLYDVGVEMLRRGRKREARRKFIQTVRREPTMARAWIRFGQTYL